VGIATWLADTLACWSVPLVIVDTPEHADYFARLTRRCRDRFAVLWVGADETIFVPAADEPRDDGPILWYLTFIPLHGMETVLRAARLLADDNRVFRLIGDGQARQAAEDLARELDLRNVEFAAAVKEIELPAEIARASVCLGVFGESSKAQRVIPNKVFQCAAAGRCVATADTPAVRNGFGTALVLVPAGDPEALARALRSLHGDALKQAGARARAAFLERFSEEALVEDFRGILSGVLASRARMRRDDKGACS